jgi:hypothetical protein
MVKVAWKTFRTGIKTPITSVAGVGHFELASELFLSSLFQDLYSNSKLYFSTGTQIAFFIGMQSVQNHIA